MKENKLNNKEATEEYDQTPKPEQTLTKYHNETYGMGKADEMETYLSAKMRNHASICRIATNYRAIEYGMD